MTMVSTGSKRRKPTKGTVEPQNTTVCADEPVLTPERATEQARRALTAANLLGPSRAVSRVVSWPSSERHGHIISVALLREGADPVVVAEALLRLAGLPVVVAEAIVGEAFVAVYQKGGT